MIRKTVWGTVIFIIFRAWREVWGTSCQARPLTPPRDTSTGGVGKMTKIEQAECPKYHYGLGNGLGRCFLNQTLKFNTSRRGLPGTLGLSNDEKLYPLKIFARFVTARLADKRCAGFVGIAQSSLPF